MADVKFLKEILGENDFKELLGDKGLDKDWINKEKYTNPDLFKNLVKALRARLDKSVQEGKMQKGDAEYARISGQIDKIAEHPSLVKSYTEISEQADKFNEAIVNIKSRTSWETRAYLDGAMDEKESD